MDTARRVLGWCTTLGIAFLFIWAGAFLFARPLLHQQGAWFGLTPHECDLIHYGGLGLLKLLVVVFFLVPYLALRLTLRPRRPK